MNMGPLTIENVTYVIDRLSAVHRAEAAAFGTTPEGIRDRFMASIEQPFTAAFYDEAGDCFGLIGLEPLGKPFEWIVRFAATEDAIQRGGLGITRFLKEFSDKIVEDTGGRLVVISAPLTEKATGWLEYMGFLLESQADGVGTFVKGGR